MKKAGFTLVELVITITILVILSTIAFVSFQSYTQDSRDANRLSSLNEIQKGLTLSYSKNGSFPTPKNATTYTGGTISLLQGTLTQESLPELQSDPKDPLSKSSYTYSTTSDGAYFQIASDIENTDVLSQTTPQQTYAKVSSALVKGNYKFDPSLPSLVVIPTTSLTNSGIFSPDNCFVTNGGSNTIGNTTCTTKKQSLLKTTDSSLVGYWDMETLTGTQLLDLSGNGFSLSQSGISLVYSTSGIVGNAINFNGEGTSQTGYYFTQNAITSKLGEKMTLSLFIKKTNAFEAEYRKILTIGTGATTNALLASISQGPDPYLFYTVIWPETTTGKNTNVVFPQVPASGIWNKIDMVYDFGIQKVYVNGTKIGENNYMKNSSYYQDKNLPLRLGYGYNNEYFKGTIDEVKIYNRALSDKEIEQQAKILGF